MVVVQSGDIANSRRPALRPLREVGRRDESTPPPPPIGPSKLWISLHCIAFMYILSFFFFGLPRYCLICADRSPALLWCYYCGERGHISDNCPDMKKRDRVTLPRDNRRPHKSNRFDRFDAREDRYSKKPYRKR